MKVRCACLFCAYNFDLDIIWQNIIKECRSTVWWCGLISHSSTKYEYLVIFHNEEYLCRKESQSSSRGLGIWAIASGYDWWGRYQELEPGGPGLWQFSDCPWASRKQWVLEAKLRVESDLERTWLVWNGLYLQGSLEGEWPQSRTYFLEPGLSSGLNPQCLPKNKDITHRAQTVSCSHWSPVKLCWCLSKWGEEGGRREGMAERTSLGWFVSWVEAAGGRQYQQVGKGSWHLWNVLAALSQLLKWFFST